MTASRMSAFYWRGQSSIFATDPAFTPTVSGKSHSEASAAAARRTVQQRTAAEGVSPGYVPGISRAERAANKEKAWARASGVR